LPNARDKFIVIMMALEMQKLKQVTAGIFVVLSLFVSSIAACACAHHSHPEKVEVEAPSCHEQAHTEKTDSQPAVTDSADTSCECLVKSPPKIFFKNENLKIEKQALSLATEDPIVDLVPVGAASAPIAYYRTISFVSRDFHNLTPGRAPPRL
jgi:hypothetical protein